MDTWEVVLILVLVTIALVMLVNQNLSSGLIQILDNSLFQLLVIGLTLGVAVVSPPVAVVSIATIVIVYYMRNLVKVQMVNVPVTNENPRIRITETTTKEIEIEAENMNTRSEDVDVVEMVLSITGNAGSNDAVAKDFKVSAPVPIENAKVIDTAQVDDPRSSSEGFQADSTDPSAEIRGPAPHAGTPTYLPGNVDTDVFTPGTGLPDGYNEIGTFPTFRPYNEVTGQYGIAERRPYQNPQKRELADFMPGNDIGSNEYKPSGVSIDDKITNLKKGIAISPNPPPNFDEVMPPFASKNVAMA